MDNEKDSNSGNTPILTPTTKVDKKNFQKQCYGVFMQMAKNSLVIVKNFEKNNTLLEKVE